MGVVISILLVILVIGLIAAFFTLLTLYVIIPAIHQTNPKNKILYSGDCIVNIPFVQDKIVNFSNYEDNTKIAEYIKSLTGVDAYYCKSQEDCPPGAENSFIVNISGNNENDTNNKLILISDKILELYSTSDNDVILTIISSASAISDISVVSFVMYSDIDWNLITSENVSKATNMKFLYIGAKSKVISQALTSCSST